MLVAAQNRFRKDIDVTQRLADDGNKEESDGKLAALFESLVFHKSGQIEDYGQVKDDIQDNVVNDTQSTLRRK